MTESAEVMKLRPSPVSFARRYALALTPLYFLALSSWLAAQNNTWGLAPTWLPAVLAPALSALAFAAGWVLRSPEAAASSLLAVLLPALLAFLEGKAPLSLPEGYVKWFPLAATAACAVTLAAVEARRRSISYEVSGAGVTIKAGLWRRQEQTIPYGSIGRIVLEQSLIGRLLNYGTIIIVSPAEWGSEYYTRGVEATVGGGKVSAGAFYARTLKEVSRDPAKCLYGVRNPGRVRAAIEAKLKEVYSAGLEQARLLRELSEKLSGGVGSAEENQ